MAFTGVNAMESVVLCLVTWYPKFRSTTIESFKTWLHLIRLVNMLLRPTDWGNL